MSEATATNERSPSQQARALMRRATGVALASLGAGQDPLGPGWPANALVTMACAADGSPILLLSTLAHHTQNLMADPRASILVDATHGHANRQAGPRVAVAGTIRRTDDARLAARFLTRYPAARAYAGFGDFAFYTMTISRLHYVGGFARAHWIDAADAIVDPGLCHELEIHEADILRHMNEDHADTLARYARHFLRARTKRARLIGVDPEGFDLRCGRSLHRIEFPRLVTGPASIRTAFVDLAASARGA